MKNKIEYWETYSNLAYNLVGFIAFYLHQDVLFCLGMQALGVSSFVYHRDKSPNRKRDTIWLFDWWAMAFMNTIVAGIHFSSITVWWALILFHVFYSYLVMGRLSVYVEVTISSVIAFVSIYLNKSIASFLVILAAMATALIVRSQDKDTEQLTYHDSPWHTAWHFLSAPIYYLAVYLDI